MNVHQLFPVSVAATFMACSFLLMSPSWTKLCKFNKVVRDVFAFCQNKTSPCAAVYTMAAKHHNQRRFFLDLRLDCSLKTNVVA